MEFSYAALDSYDALKTEIPPYEQFYSALAGGNTLELDWIQYQELLLDGKAEKKVLEMLHLDSVPLTGRAKYSEIKDLWRKLGIKYLYEWASVYCLHDCLPSIEATEKLVLYFRKISGFNMSEFNTISKLGWTHLCRQLTKQTNPRASFYCQLQEKAADDIVDKAKLGGGFIDLTMGGLDGEDPSGEIGSRGALTIQLSFRPLLPEATSFIVLMESEGVVFIQDRDNIAIDYSP